jgi:hypothetical protein
MYRVKFSAHQSDITLDVKQGDERFELRIAAHHTLLVQSLTKELRRISEIVGECRSGYQS